jgi:hypothetical protein
MRATEEKMNMDTVDKMIRAEEIEQSSSQASFYPHADKPRLTWKETFTTKRGWYGDYDYAALCMPRIPFIGKNKVVSSPFFGPNDEIPIMVAILMGVQRKFHIIFLYMH